MVSTSLPCSNGCTPWPHLPLPVIYFVELDKAPHHFVCLGAGARADLVWWKCFLQGWSGTSFFPFPNPSHNVYSNASGTYGCGAVVDSLGYFQLEWLRGWEEIDLSVKELVPVVVTAVLWGGLWRWKPIFFHSQITWLWCQLCLQKQLNLIHLLRCFSFTVHFTASMYHVCMSLGQ